MTRDELEQFLAKHYPAEVWLIKAFSMLENIPTVTHGGVPIPRPTLTLREQIAREWDW